MRFYLQNQNQPTKQHSEREHASLEGACPQFHLQCHKKKYRQIYSESIKHMVIQADIYEIHTFTNELLLKSYKYNEVVYFLIKRVTLLKQIASQEKDGFLKI